MALCHLASLDFIQIFLSRPRLPVASVSCVLFLLRSECFSICLCVSVRVIVLALDPLGAPLA